MKLIVNFLVIFALLTAKNLTAQLTNDPVLTKTILTNDSLLFEIGFNTCRIDLFEQLLSDDFEFYHDKSGFSDKPKFLNDLKRDFVPIKTNINREENLFREALL